MIESMPDPPADGSCWLFGDETLVYEEADWGIIKQKGEPGSTPDVAAYATHRCTEPNEDGKISPWGEYAWKDLDNWDRECNQCKADVPDGIVTLIRIYNWER